MSASSWKVLETFRRFGSDVTKYVHPCGLRVCVAAVKGPLVHGYFTLATEAHDDDGLPHTLEHLVFLGSEKYPYKGLLDKMANRCFAQGTNAWTDTDHTCYTLSTAGRDGFLNLLPVYLDHILFATCSPEGFVTEVHHIDGEGRDAGVVYSEMQARENGQDDLTGRVLMRAFYPGVCGYKSETGGLLHNLRTSCTHAKVAQYHRDFYRAENLCVMVIGDVPPAELFAALQPVVDSVESKPKPGPFARPWSSPVPPLTATSLIETHFPSDDESVGDVKIAWRGPLWSDFHTREALGVVLDMLTINAVSPLQDALVQREDPLCNDVSYMALENAEMAYVLQCANVATERAPEVLDIVKDVLKDIVESSDEEFDHEFLLSILQQRKLALLKKAEMHPEDIFTGGFIGDFLYGNQHNALELSLSDVDILDELNEKPISYWKSIMKTFLLDGHNVTVIGIPNAKLAEDMAVEEQVRLQTQKEALGEAGLAAKAATLKIAVDVNNRDPPMEVVNSLPIPSVAHIRMHECGAWTKGVSPNTLPHHHQLASLPCFVHANNIESEFVTITVVAPVPADSSLVKYLELYNDMLFESPVTTLEGEVLPYEDVVEGLASDVVHHSSHLGYEGDRFRPGELSQLQFVSVTVDVARFDRGVQWLGDIFQRSVFDVERIGVSRARLLGDATEGQRDGITIARGMLKNALFVDDRSSSVRACNIQRQYRLLNELEAQLAADADAVTAAFTALRDALSAPENIRIHIKGPLERIDNLVAPLQTHLSLSSPTPTPAPSFPWAFEKLKLAPQRSAAISLGSVESSYMIQGVECLNSFAHPDIPALFVLLEYLTATEGPMWRLIRGQGYSYHFYMRLNVEEGMIYFGLFKASQLVQAYDTARTIVASIAHCNDFISGASVFDADALDAAKAAVVFEIIEREKSPASAANESLKVVLSGQHGLSNAELLARITSVTAADLQRALQKYVPPLFDHSRSLCAICCATNKIEEIVGAFADRQRVLLQPTSLDDAIPDSFA